MTNEQVEQVASDLRAKGLNVISCEIVPDAEPEQIAVWVDYGERQHGVRALAMKGVSDDIHASFADWRKANQ